MSHRQLFSIKATGRQPGRLPRQRGTTLIEVLITLVVLSIGLLGLAALQAISLRANQTAYYRTQATSLAYEITDHARANRSRVLAAGNLPNATFWNERAAQLLPDGQVNATVNSGNGQITIDIQWLDNRDENAPDDGYLTFRAQSRF